MSPKDVLVVYFGLHAEGPVPGKAVNKVLDGTACFIF